MINPYLVRKFILEISYKAHVGHIASALSVADIIAVLYGNILKKSDRFILSKGHAAAALYAALYLKKYITKKQLYSFCSDGSLLGVHPDYNPKLGIELTTGSLGHGLSVGVGMAMGLKKSHVYVLLSDAELNEGSVWEAVMFAGHHELSNLTVIIDVNGNQAFGKTKDIIDLSPIDKKFSIFGWNTEIVDGHNSAQLSHALLPKSTPTAVIAKTISGYGVSYMEGTIAWHYWPMNTEQYQQALDDIYEKSIH